MSRGFSTLEMLIAMALLISAFVVTLLLDSSLSISVDTQTNAEALTLARKALEDEQSLGRKDFRLVVATSSVETVGGTPYIKTVTVSEPDYFTKKVEAKITWPGTLGRSPYTSLTTLITNFANAVGGDTCSTVLADVSGAHANWNAPSATNSTLSTVVGDTSSATYAITDIDASEGYLYAAVNNAGGVISATPDTTAGTAQDGAVAGGIAWSSPANALTGNGVNATSGSNLNGTKPTDYLKLTNFGLSVPAWATITGIKVELNKSRGTSGTGSILDSQIKLIKNGVVGGTSGTNHADTTTAWPSTSTYVQAGAADLWGETWTPADLNSANFGVAISATGSSGGTRFAQVDNVRITVSYTRQFYALSLSNPANPSFLGSLGSNSVSTAINAVAAASSSAGSYAYFATNSTAAPLEIIDVSNPAAPFVRASFAIPGISSAGDSIFYKNGYAYLGLFATGSNKGHEFSIIDVSNPASIHEVGFWPPTPPTAPFSSFNNDINAVYVKDGYAYLATPFSPELIVLNITNPASPTVAGTYDAPDTTGNGKSLYPVGDTIYFGRTVTGSNPEFYELNGADLANLQTNNGSPMTKEVGSSVIGLNVRDWLASLLTTRQGSTPGKLQLINAVTGASVANVALPGGSSASGTSLDCEGNYLYAASVDSSNRGYITAVTGN